MTATFTCGWPRKVSPYFTEPPVICDQCLLHPLQIDYPEIVDGVIPRHRFMAAYEQKVEPPDRKWQYLLFAAEPYETIGFKVGTD